jgi:eukaryotic-like serine/threonine-protein kinase
MLKPYRKAELSFEEIKEIGSDGQNSRTFLANDLQLGAEIVVKQIDKAKLAVPEAYFAEAKALYISAHQNVVQLHYACEDDDHVFIAMPFYAAGSIKGLMAERHLTVREIVRLGCQTLSGLHNIHSKGLIHFDIKPDNILLTPRREALLSDFGLAKQTKLGLAEPDGMYIRIAPPEAMNGPPYNLTFDIYQIGVTLYRMCVGSAEFDRQFARFVGPDGVDRPALDQALQRGEFPDRSGLPPHIPARMEAVIMTCLKVAPDERYPSALAVANALARVDSCLDWELIAHPVNRVWRKLVDGKVHQFTANQDGSTEFVKIQPDGNQRRKNDACKARMTQTQIKGVLRDN